MTDYTLFNPGALADLLANAPGLYPRTVSIYEPSNTQDLLGQPVISYSPVSGLTTLSCQIASTHPKTGRNSETKSADMTYAKREVQIDIFGYYPQIREHMQAVDDAGDTWDITAAEADSMLTATRLVGQIVTV